jgi:hypothetical protein
MLWRSTRRILRWSVAVAMAFVVSVILMEAVGFNVRPRQPPEFGWTAYPMLAVAHWSEPGSPLPPGKLPPRQCRGVTLGTLVTWAAGTKTLYIHW